MTIMTIQKSLTKAPIMIFLCFLLIPYTSKAELNGYPDGDGVGQFIQITTRLHSFVGKPTWLLIIRDVDHNQNIPYLFDIRRGENFWVALTYGKHYLITVSRLQIETYQSRYNKYKNYRINNFCHLESNGRIIRGESMNITLEGNLTPDTASTRCIVLRYKDPVPFTVVPPNSP